MQESGMASHKSSTSGPTRPELPRLDTVRIPQSRLPTRGTGSTVPNGSSLPRASSRPLDRGSSTSNTPPAQSARLIRQDDTISDSLRSKTQSTHKVDALPRPDSARRGRLVKPRPPMTQPSRVDSGTSGNIQTPSLTSGSSISTNDSSRNNTLRRKKSTIDRYAANANGAKAGSKPTPGVESALRPNGSNWEGSILGISVPSASPQSMSPEPLHHPTPEAAEDGTSAEFHQNSETGTTEVMVPPRTPGIPLSGSPSTRYSGSPGLFSYASTPTSMSSYSPGILSSKLAPRARTISPSQQNQQPVPRRKLTPDQPPKTAETQGLMAVDESFIPSSFVSTEQAPQPIKEAVKHSPPQETNNRPKFQAPPELAHLLNEPRPPKEASKPERPVRPSRDGTPTLSSREPSPIIRSNLSPFFNSYHKRQGSAGTSNTSGPTNHSSDSIPSLSSDATRPRLQTNTNLSSRNPSPTTGPHSRSATPLDRSVGTKVNGAVIAEAQAPDSRSRKPPTAASPDGFNKPSRFGFFSRRTKEDNAGPLERPKREPRKGPMAGTGHEGYGRRPLRGRRPSISSTDNDGRSASAGSNVESVGKTSNRKSSLGSNSGDSTMDEFLSERLTPVFVRGEGGSVKSDRMSWDFASNPSSQSTPQLSDGDSRRSSDDKPSFLPKSNARPYRSPSPFKGRLLGQQPPGLNKDALVRSTKAHVTKNAQVDQAKPQSKPNKRWNFFQRTHNSKKEQEPFKPAQDQHLPQAQFAAHYAMTNDDRLDIEDIDRMMQDADGYSSVEEIEYPQARPIPTMDVWSKSVSLAEEEQEENAKIINEPSTARAGRQQAHSFLLPSPPTLGRPFASQDGLVKVASPPQRAQHHQVSKAQTVSTDNSKVEREIGTPKTSLPAASALPPLPLPSPVGSPSPNSPGRPSRLAQVGRIPQVISKRDRDRKLPAQSFSRPFASGQPRPNVNRNSRADFTNRQTNPFKAARQSVDGVQSPTKYISEKDESGQERAIDTATSICAADILSPPEFFSFPPRHNSELSYTSSSGNGSFPGQPWGLLSQNQATLAAEEVWNEYDDLIDNVLSPVDEPRSAKSALGAPFQYQAATSAKDRTTAGNGSTTGQAVSNKGLDTDAFADPIRRSSTAPLTTAHLRQQRSSFLSALHSEGTRGSGITELLKGYAEPRESLGEPKRDTLSLPPSTRPSSTGTHFSLSPTVQSPARSTHSQSATAIESSPPTDATTKKSAKRGSEDMVEQANLRFGALMTSKWLSFGRVLFSPAHSEVKDGKGDRVLIIDGLGKDWSYYCALTYPNATVYNLGPIPTASQANSASAWQSLANHRHIHHASISSPFPFPRGFFSVAVFRFPIASSEPGYRTALSECKRVLRPGGHLELSVLDIDMLNMGNKARRAVRQVKIKMQAIQRDVCLKPKSDSMVRLLGMRGYGNINRCMVGVPAAGILSSAASSPVSSDNDKMNAAKNNTVEIKRDPNASTTQKKESRTSTSSFGDIFKSHPGANDSGKDITKMVARVGRWWWSSCYETPFLKDEDTSSSIWDDAAFLQECEEHGTSFKLLVCYAQKPNMAVRRTVSV